MRLHDNEALHHAVSSNNEVVGLFCVEPSWFKSHALGFENRGAHRLQFLRETVEQLQQQWKKLGATLLVDFGLPKDLMLKWSLKLNIDAVYFNSEFAVNEVYEEKSVILKLKENNINSKAFWSGTLHKREDVSAFVLPDLFTTYRKQVEQKLKVPDALPSPQEINGIIVEEGDFTWPKGAFAIKRELDVNKFRGGEIAALERLNEYLWETDAIATYKETRNGLLPKNYSSKLSPWLAVGAISPRKIYDELMSYEQQRTKNESTYWLFFELLWRDFFKWVSLKHKSYIFKIEGIQHLHINWETDVAVFTKWRLGQTGNDFVDANMLELLHTGFMSNRGRQNVASYLTKNLGINWLWGAAWFESCLVDYDPCSNYGNWMYVAGVGNDGRNFRYFNTAKQAAQYDSDAAYRNHWLTLQSTPIKEANTDAMVAKMEHNFKKAWAQKKSDKNRT